MEVNIVYKENMKFTNNNNNQQIKQFSILDNNNNTDNSEFTTHMEICEPNFRTQEDIDKLRYW